MKFRRQNPDDFHKATKQCIQNVREVGQDSFIWIPIVLQKCCVEENDMVERIPAEIYLDFDALSH